MQPYEWLFDCISIKYFNMSILEFLSDCIQGNSDDDVNIGGEIMKISGINRVLILVRDFDKAVSQYAKLLGVAFHDAKTEEVFGIRAALSWEACIEIVSPLPEANNPVAKEMLQFMSEHGEGLYSVGFNVDNADEFHRHAQGVGFETTLLEFSPDLIKTHLQDRFRTYKEYVMNPIDTCGVNCFAAQLEPK